MLLQQGGFVILETKLSKHNDLVHYKFSKDDEKYKNIIFECSLGYNLNPKTRSLDIEVKNVKYISNDNNININIEENEAKDIIYNFTNCIMRDVFNLGVNR